jgi:hypothetical protein
MNQIRRRGAASGWIVLVVVLGLLIALVAWRMIDQGMSTPRGGQPSSQPSE